MLPLGSTCPLPVLSPTLKTGKFPQGGRPGSDLHIWVVVPSPGPKATAGQSAGKQAATRCFFAAIQSTPHPAPTTLWPLNTLVSPMHPGFFCLPSKWLAGERDEMSRTQVYLWTQHWVSSPLFIPTEFESSKKDLLPKVQMVLPDCMLQTPSAESCRRIHSPVYVHAKNFYIRGDLPW